MSALQEVNSQGRLDNALHCAASKNSFQNEIVSSFENSHEFNNNPLKVIFDNIPNKLQKIPRWVICKADKAPMQAHGVAKKINLKDESSWSTFSQAENRYNQGGFFGVGIVLNGDGLVGIDIDNCVTNGVPSKASLVVMEAIGCSYIELSPSGTGLRGFGYSKAPEGAVGIFMGIQVELYMDKRYLTVTGHSLGNAELGEAPGFEQAVSEIKGHRGKIASISSDSSIPSVTSVPSVTSDSSVSSVTSVSSVAQITIPDSLIPTGPGQRNRGIFQVARWLKGKFPGVKREDFKAVVYQWFLKALPYITTKDFGITWADFINSYDKVKHPHGATLAEVIKNLPPVPVNSPAFGQFGPKGDFLLQVCLGLQEKAGAEPFFLTSRTAGYCMDLAHTKAASLLRAFVNVGALVIVIPHTTKKGARYRLKL